MIVRGWFAGVLLGAIVTPATAFAVASAELYRTQAYLYGRFEARIRYAAGDGVVSSFFLWKVGSEVSGTYWNELDFEKLNANCRMQTNALYGNPLNSSEQFHTMPSDMCDAYHDYAFEWTPTYIAWFIDGREIRRNTGQIAEAFAQNAPQGMRIHFNVWPGNENFGGNFNPAILPVRQYISWVQYSSYQNGNFTFQWREDFNGSSLPSGWAIGDWASPYNLSTHNSRNVTFANGIAVLSLTADNATGYTGVPPADTGSGGMSGGAGVGGAAVAGAGAAGMATAGGGAGGGSTAGAGGTGTGGAASAGGAGMPTGGVATAGGAGTGGVATAGADGTAGAGAATAGAGPATAGASGMGTAGAVGGAGSAGGSAATTGGAMTMGGALTAGTTTVPGSDSDSGCSCRIAGSRTDRIGGAAAGLFGLMLVLRRRRRSVD